MNGVWAHSRMYGHCFCVFFAKNNNSAIHIDLSVLGQYLHLPSFNEIVLT